MRGKDRKTRLVVVLVCFLVVCSVAGLYVLWSVHGYGDWLRYGSGERYTHYYSVSFRANPDVHYSIRLPVPVNETGAFYPGMEEEIELKGTGAAASLVSTSYGTALEVQGQGNLTVRWGHVWKASDKMHYDNLSLISVRSVNATNCSGQIWFSGTTSPVLMYFYFQCLSVHLEHPGFLSGGAGTTYSTTEPSLTTGWQEVEFSVGEGMVIN